MLELPGTADPRADDTPSATHRLWARYGNHALVVIFALVTFGVPVANSVGYTFGVAGFLGATAGTIPGVYTYVLLITLTSIVVSFALVRPRDMGLFLPRAERLRLDNWDPAFRVAAVGVCTFIALRFVLSMAGVTASAWTGGPPIMEIPWVVHAAFYEEIPAAALIILALRARWHPVAVVVFIAAIRSLFHLYQGGLGFIPAIVWPTIFAYAFLKYRRVGPLIAAHLMVNVAGFAMPVVVGHILT